MFNSSDKSGFVYLLLGENNWIKIGRTNNPTRRFRQWRYIAKLSGYRMAPVMMIEVENQHSIEKMLHKAFDHHRINEKNQRKGLGNEWFKLPPNEIHDLGLWADELGEIVTYFDGVWP